VVLANNCGDDTAALARKCLQAQGRTACQVVERELPAAKAHAGWARRLALEAGRRHLSAPDDVLLSTDADTWVAPDWLSRTLDHLDAGYDAVAGLALLRPAELRRLDPGSRRRFAALQRYERALDALRHDLSAEEPWPRHFYEGGASIALTCRSFDALGALPTPCVGEDKALFDRVRRRGFRIRHATDVRVATSCRFSGRAPEGAADTLRRWALQGDDAPVLGLSSIESVLDPGDHSVKVSFASLEQETRRAKSVRRSLRCLETPLSV
jgi:hypothetical protein